MLRGRRNNHYERNGGAKKFPRRAKQIELPIKRNVPRWHFSAKGDHSQYSPKYLAFILFVTCQKIVPCVSIVKEVSFE